MCYREALGPAQDLCGVTFGPMATEGIQGYLPHKNTPPLGPYSSPMPWDLW